MRHQNQSTHRSPRHPQREGRNHEQLQNSGRYSGRSYRDDDYRSVRNDESYQSYDQNLDKDQTTRRRMDNDRYTDTYGFTGYGSGSTRSSLRPSSYNEDIASPRDHQAHQQWQGEGNWRSEPEYRNETPYRSGSQYGSSSYGRPAFDQQRESSRGFSGMGPKGYKRSDERIKEDVCETLFHDSSVDASDIEVEVSEGIVTLSGSVDTRMAKRQAEECIEHLSGVKDVTNNIRVDSSLGNEKTLMASDKSGTAGSAKETSASGKTKSAH